MAVSQEMLEEQEMKKQKERDSNLNKFSKRYVMQNNMHGAHKWMGTIFFCLQSIFLLE